MKALTDKEKELMNKLWEHEEMTTREILELYPEPRPHFNTIATFLRILEQKGWVKHRLIGNTNLYRAILTEEDMGRETIKSVISKFFAGSISGMISALIKDEDLSDEEINELKELVNRKSKR